MNEASKPRRFSSATIAAVVAGVFFTLKFVVDGSKLPYVYTDFSRAARFYILLPAFIGIFVYIIFFFRGQKGKSAYLLILEKYQDREERIRMILSCILGILLFSIGFATYSIGVSARITDHTASDPFMHVYKIQTITERGGTPGFIPWIELDLSDPASGEVVMLPLNRTDYADTMHGSLVLRVGETICVRGRTSIFGTIIDTTTRNADHC